MPVSKSRKYCCICSNYRGKYVDGRNVSLHRFPANDRIRRLWLQRARLVRKDFVHTANSQICSAHFVDGCGPSKQHPVPSVFPKKVFKTSNPENMECVLLETDEKENCEPEDEEHTTSETLSLSTACDSVLQTSLRLHDYCGPFDGTNLPFVNNKAVQTDSLPTVRSIATQTDQLDSYYHSVNSCTQTTQTKMVETGTQVRCPVLTYDVIKHDDQKVFFYTGIPDAATFDALFDEVKDNATSQTARKGASLEQGRPRHLQLIDEFFLVLMRLRLGLLLEDLADRFYIGTSTCGLIFNRWIDYLDSQMAPLVQWPNRQVVNEHMPSTFKEKYPNCRIVLDCTELRTETPASLQNKSLMFSDYKSHMTWKGLVGISPAGVVTYVSDLWTGSASDKQITIESGLVDLCDCGDAIMVDKGFLISDLTTPRGIELIIPPFKNKKRQLSKREVDMTRTIANLRIHVERQMERIKNFHILKCVMPITMSQQVSKIWKLCVRLTNLQPKLCK